MAENAFVVSSIRTPFAKSMTAYRNISTFELMSAVLKELVSKNKLVGQQVGEVVLGAVMNSSSNWNLARECALESGLSPYTPGYNVQKACGTSLEAAGQIANKIRLGQIRVGIAGGVDTNSDAPIMVARKLAKKLLALNAARSFGERLKLVASFRPSDLVPQIPAVVEPRTGLSMGQHCEKMVQEWKISRIDQDTLALVSHQNGARAYEKGFFEDLVFEFMGNKKDLILRGDTTIEKLGKLKPAFEFSEKGTLTAGNSSPLTDGASAVLLASESEAKKRGYNQLARFLDFQSAAVDFVKGDGLLMAPTIAVAQLLERNNLKLQDFDFYEIHEAFTGQVLCTLKAWESDSYCKKFMNLPKALGSIDRSKLNVNGGSVALGHPFAATGARIVGSLAKMLSQKGSGKGLISICTAGGMGVAAILEA
ncbi:MAG: acetyl-CoA C-acetyltransferase [Bacteriovoracia bacterium]